MRRQGRGQETARREMRQKAARGFPELTSTGGDFRISSRKTGRQNCAEKPDTEWTSEYYVLLLKWKERFPYRCSVSFIWMLTKNNTGPSTFIGKLCNCVY